MKQLIIFLGLLFFVQILVAQTSSRKVLSTLGGSYQDSNFSATYTVGETIITTLSAGGITATQGFQQPSCDTDSSSFSASGIDSYLWNGITYTLSGTYLHTYINSFGCDSIVTLNLTIYHTTVSMSLQNVIQISPSIFEYDVILTNTGNTSLALRGYSCGINHASGMRNGGTLTHTFISRDASLSSIPNVVPGYTASTNHLRLFTSDAAAGNEVNLLPAMPVRIATMRVSNSVPFPADFYPNLILQTVAAIGKTQCIANCVVSPPGSNYTINGIANTPAANTIQGLTGIVNTPCLYLNASALFSASGVESTIATCNGSGSGSAIITLSGAGANTLPGTYSVDGAASIAYTTNPFTISNLSSGSHTITLANSNACSSTVMQTISQTFFTPSILQNDTTICLGSNIQLNAISSSSTLPTNLQSGLVAWYPFNGNANDESGNGNNCSLYNGPLLSTDRIGNANQAYNLDGENDWINTDNSFLQSNNSHTISIWWQTADSTKISQTLFNTNPHPIENFAFHYSSSNIPPYGMSYGLGNGVSWNIMHPDAGQILTPPTLGQWHHCIWVKDTSLNWYIYFDGNLIQTVTSLVNIGSQIANLRFGAENAGFPTGGANFQGKLDDIGIWNRALSLTEIQQLYTTDSSTYLWSTGATTPSINVSPTQTTTYYLTKTNGSNVCIDSVTVTVNQPNVFAGNAQTVCEGDTVVLSASGANTYTWSDAVIDGQAFTASYTHTYTVTGTNSYGCTATSQVTVNVNVNPIPVITPSNATTFCNGESVVLQANIGAGISYTWYNNNVEIVGATASHYIANQSGSYTVQTTRANACSAVSLPQVVTVSNCNVDVNLKLCIQGYYVGMGNMAPVLMHQNVLLDSSITDTIVVELHHAQSPYGLVSSQQAILHTNGTASCNFPYFNGSYYLLDSYYVAVKHRNGLTTWSANPITISSITNYDFTTSSSQAYGDNMIEMEQGIWAFFSGELNYDDNIDILDYPLYEFDAFNFNSGYYATDINGDGNVDLLDGPIIENNIFNFVYSNQPAWTGTLPSVTTNAVTSIVGSSALGGGNIISDGGLPILSKGVCWSLHPNPTISDAHSNDGIGSSNFTSNLTNLNFNTIYYVRAYASNANGVVYGNTVSFVSASLAVGLNYQGGIIAYVFQPGDPGYVAGEMNGLITTPTNLGTAPWGCNGVLIGGTSTALGSGKANTQQILTGCTTPGIAAKICDDLLLNGYSDWYLPSKDELNKLYINSSTIGGFINAFYWTSSEENSNDAWLQNWLIGDQNYVGKFNTAPTVRAIRTFSNIITLGVVSTSVSGITQTSAISGGSIVAEANETVTARGICWSVNPNPTTALITKTIDGNGVGSYSSSLTGLTPGTTYYIRAYAISANGTMYGNEVSFTTNSLAIGDSYGGGKVAYILQPGDNGYVVGEVHGIIAAESDQSSGAEWGCSNTSIGNTFTTLGYGQYNTSAILSGCSEVGIAAKICDELVLNGYVDWYLPSKDELDKLYQSKSLVGGFSNNHYKSSSEFSTNYNWSQYFYDGLQFSSPKHAPSYVRAVRSF